MFKKNKVMIWLMLILALLLGGIYVVKEENLSLVDWIKNNITSSSKTLSDDSSPQEETNKNTSSDDSDDIESVPEEESFSIKEKV